MGSMNMGGGKGGGFSGDKPNGQRGERNQMPAGEGEAPAIEVIPLPGVEETETTAENIILDRAEEIETMLEQNRNNKTPNESGENMMPQDFGNRMPASGGNNRFMPESVNNAGQSMQSTSTVPLILGSVLVLLIGLFVAKKYKR